MKTLQIALSRLDCVDKVHRVEVDDESHLIEKTRRRNRSKPVLSEKKNESRRSRIYQLSFNLVVVFWLSAFAFIKQPTDGELGRCGGPVASD